jgi:hypothetical protein
MKHGYQFLPPRQAVIYATTRRMLDETAMNAASFAMAVAELYLATTAMDVRQVNFRNDSGEALRHNAQILRRYMDGTVKTMPADLEDAWVMTLPEPYRSECEQALARRRGRLSIELPKADGEDAAAMAQVLAEQGAMCAAWGKALADGCIDRDERDDILRASDGLIAAVVRFRNHLMGARPVSDFKTDDKAARGLHEGGDRG